MQHPRGVAGLTPGVTAWTREKIAALSREEFRAMQALVDEAGVRSARAQGLPNPITSVDRLAPDQRLYLFCSDATSPLRGPSAVLGILKVGSKNLFVSKHDDPLSPVVEIEPTCVLDFYVHERTQRMGVGGRLFDAFLDAEGRHPGRLAYDRPSEKFLAFLAKNHGLAHFKPQNNNFVVFREYWRVKPRPASAALEAKKAAMRGGRGSRIGLAAAARAKAAAARAERAEAETRRTGRTGTAPLDGSSNTGKNENKQNGIFGGGEGGGGGFGGGNLGGGFGNLGTRPGGARTRINPARPARRFDGFELDDGARVGVRISESSRRRADENDADDESRARRRSGSGEAAAAARGPPPPRGPERASDNNSAAGPEKPPLDEAPRRAFSGVSLRRTPPPPPVKTTGGSSSTAGGGSSSPTSAAAADERGRRASLAPRTPPSRGPPKGPPLGGSTPRHSRDPKIPVRVRERGLPLFEDDDEPRRGDVGGEATRLARSPAPDEPLPPQALARDGGGAMLSNLSNLSHRATFSRRSDDVSRGGRGGNLELDAPRADAGASAAFESAPWGSTLMLSPKMRRERRGRGGERLSVEEEEAQRRLERRLERRPFGEDLGTVESSEYGLSYQRFVRAVKAMGGDDDAGVGAGERARRREAEGAHLGDGERRRRGGHGADEGASGLLGGGADDDDENVSDARRRASLTGGDYAHVGPPAPGYYRARRPDVPAGAMAAHGAAPTYHYRSADAPFLDERGRYPRRYDHAARGRGFRVGVGVDGYAAVMHHHDTAAMNHDTAVMMHRRAPLRARERSSLLGPRNAHASFSYGETQDAFWRARAEGTVALERGGRFNPRREGLFGGSLHPGGGRRGDGVRGDSFGRFAGASSMATKGRESEVVRAGRRAMGGRWARGGDDAWGGGGGYRAG